MSAYSDQRRASYLARQRASSDLVDIDALRHQPATERYFLRRIREKRDQCAAAVLNDDQLSAQDREIQRQLYKAYEGLARMMDDDATEHQRTLAAYLPDESAPVAGS